MSKFSGEITPELIQRLELAADSSFNLIVRDLENNPNDTQDYPVGSTVLDNKGVFALGEGVATDVRTGQDDAHAEINALAQASRHYETMLPSGIVVSTLESCERCTAGTIQKVGETGLIAYVIPRKYAEGLGHVRPRDLTKNGPRNIQQLQLKHPRLQVKGQALLANVKRDPQTKITVVNKAPLASLFRSIEEEFPLN